MVSRTSGGLGDDTVEPQCRQIQFVDERFNNPDRVVLRHVVIQAVREQRSLPPVLAFHETFHPASPPIAGHETITLGRFHTPSPLSGRCCQPPTPGADALQRPSRSAWELAQLGWLGDLALLSDQAPGPLATTVKLGRASDALVLCTTLNAATGRLRPFSSRFPRSSSLTTASTAPATRLLTRIWRSLASAQSRAARLHTVPIAV